MKSRVALLCLGLVTAGFCVDEYLPIEAGKTEIDVGVSLVFPEVGDAAVGIPLQVKYGVMPGLDVEVAATAGVSGTTGLSQIDVAAKYAIGSTGLAPYIDVVLPFAVGEYADGYTGLGIAPGVVFGKNFDRIQAIAKASYQINMESEGVTPGAVLDIYLKPGYMIDSKLAAYVGLDFKMIGESEAPAPIGTTAGGNVITLLPASTTRCRLRRLSRPTYPSFCRTTWAAHPGVSGRRCTTCSNHLDSNKKKPREPRLFLFS
jgi:hypothetical protein